MSDGTADAEDGFDYSAAMEGLWDYIAANPHTWMMKAEQLREVAELLRRERLGPAEELTVEQAVDDFRVGQQYMMLNGMAVEAILKGILIFRSPEYVAHDRLARILTRDGHNLVRLWEEAARRLAPKLKQALRMAPEFKRTLRRMSHAIICSGRYPVTTHREGMGGTLGGTFDRRTTVPQVDRVWGKLLRAFDVLVGPVDEEAIAANLKEAIAELKREGD